MQGLFFFLQRLQDDNFVVEKCDKCGWLWDVMLGKKGSSSFIVFVAPCIVCLLHFYCTTALTNVSSCILL